MFEMIFPNENLFIVILNGVKRYVAPRNNVVFVKKSSDIKDYLHKSLGYHYFILHSLRVDVAKILTGFQHPNYCWIEWGADLYNNLLEYRGFPLCENKEIKKLLLKDDLPYPFAVIRQKIDLFYRQRIVSRFVKQVRYFMPDSTPDELPLLLHYYPELSHLQYKEIFYYPIDEVLGEELINKRCEGTNIIVNHSASITGNHIGVFERLKRLNINNRRVIVPISYGYDNVINYIETKGYDILGECFTPVKDYMPLQDYNKLLLSANVFVYGHWRQEAVGNILVALYIGGKVFLSSKSPMYSYYKKLGLHLWHLDEMNDTTISTPMNQKMVDENRRIISRQYSRERLARLIREDFPIL